jgi:hypothetical protein
LVSSAKGKFILSDEHFQGIATISTLAFKKNGSGWEVEQKPTINKQRINTHSTMKIPYGNWE